MIDVKVPALAESVTEGEIGTWLRKDGEPVRDPLVAEAHDRHDGEQQHRKHAVGEHEERPEPDRVAAQHRRDSIRGWCVRAMVPAAYAGAV